MRWLRHTFGVLVALVILFEEWGWEPLQAALGRLARWPPLAWVERQLQRLPPYAALAVFAVPGLALLPIKLGALALITRGHALGGVLLIVAAKLIGTAIVARLFALLQPALMRLGWFARGYARWTVWKEHWMGRVRASAAWQAAARMLRRVRRVFRRMR
jgi:hypothetical protein